MIRITLVFFLTASYLQVCSAKNSTLELVHVLFRHGDRTVDIQYVYPKDPYINLTYDPIGFGQLTNAGKKRMYLLGKTLHKRYKNFLGTYKPGILEARCTDYDRTKVSLELVLASLFPPKNELIWEKGLKWQPIPFSYWRVQDDHILGEAYKNCEKYKKLYHDLINTTQALKMYENYTETIDYLKKHAGMKLTPKDIAEVYFTLTTEIESGLELPNWAQSIYPDVLVKLAAIEYDLSTGNFELKRLAAGFLLNKIIADTHASYQNKRMFLYSGHEYNIVFLTKILGVYFPHVPSYGECILIEIHNIKGVRGVKIFYIDHNKVKVPKKMKIPHCHSFCRFDHFVKIHEKYLVSDAKECEIN